MYQARGSEAVVTDLHSFLYQAQSCMGLPSTHMQDCCVVQELCWQGVQPVCLLLLRSILSRLSSFSLACSSVLTLPHKTK